jgi:hypothetical protein
MHPTARLFRFIPLALALALAGGCAIGQLIGGMAASAEREGSRKVAAKYTGLRNRTFAVFIAADRTLQSEFPQVVPAFTREITRRLSENAGAAGVLPADDVLQFQFRRPGWTAMSQEDIAKELEVDRLVFIELNDFTLNDPGNRYEWRGVASGTIRVVENNESRFKLAFNEPVRVAYPDSEGQSIDTIAAQTVLSELSRRFCERSAWAFYDHEEANILKY